MSHQVIDNRPVIEKVIENIEKVMIGQKNTAILSIVALLAKGHVLLEDVPGVGKTMMVRTLAKSVSAEFKRIQFTPDLLPSDVIGSSVYNPKELNFEYRPGPLMGNIILADEINRTSPKTQSALLEGMEEGNVTVDGKTMPLPAPFLVMATQNPVEYEGTYPLPEAQLDRFLLKMSMGYPSRDGEIEVLERADDKQKLESITSVITIEELISLQAEANEVFVDQTIKEYIVDIVHHTRNHPSVFLGVSPRGSIAIMKAAKAYAFINGRNYVIPDDIKFLAPFVFTHRMILNPEARFSGGESNDVLNEILTKVNIPTSKGFS